MIRFLLFLLLGWLVYHYLLRPLFLGYNDRKKSDTFRRNNRHSSGSSHTSDDKGEYIDYEEIK